MEQAATARRSEFQLDACGFAAVVRAQQGMVFSIAYHCLGDRALAEEVAQDVFLQLHRKLAEIQSPEHVVFWLRRVAAHRSIDAARRWREQRRLIALDHVPEPSYEGGEADAFLFAALRKYVRSLPPKPRAVLVLRFQEDMEAHEIAEVLGMPAATVRSHLRRGLAAVRAKLERVHGSVRS